nr:manganese catalase family protein [Thermobifida fusca]
MFRHDKRLQFEAKPEKPDPLFAKKLQELIGGAYGEMTVTMQYLFQGWNCRIEGKYKDLIMDVATEEIGHVEMLATMVARLLEGAPSDTTAEAVRDPVVAAVVGGMDVQQAIVSGGGATLADSSGTPWNGKYIVASGNLLADFYANVAAEAQGRVQTARLYAMTDDPGVKEMLKFNLARDTVHQNLWLAAIEELKEDGLEGAIAPNALFDEETRSMPTRSGACPLAALPRKAAGCGGPPRTASAACATWKTPNRWADRLPSRRPATRCTGRSRVLPAKARRKAPSVPRGRGKASPTKSKTPSTRRCPAAEPQDSAAAPPELLRSAAARSAVRTVRGAVPGHLW